MKPIIIFKSIVVSAVVLAAVACSDTPPPSPPPPPTTIKQLHESISEVSKSVDGETTTIYVWQKTVWNAASAVYSLADIALDITKGMKHHNLMASTKKVSFSLLAPTQDEYGNEKPGFILSIAYLREDLMKINVNNPHFSPQQMLDLYDGTSWVIPMSSQAIRAFCRDSISAAADRFCRQEMGRRLPR